MSDDKKRVTAAMARNPFQKCDGCMDHSDCRDPGTCADLRDAWDAGFTAGAAQAEADGAELERARIRGVFKRVADIDAEMSADGTVVTRGPSRISGNTLHALIAYLFTRNRP